MKQLSIIFCVLFSVLPIDEQLPIEGVWNTGKENTKIEIKKSNNQIEGKILSSDNVRVPVGKLMIKDIVEKNGVFEGKLYVIKYRKWIDVLLNRKETELIISISSGRIHKTIRWELTQ